MAIGGRHAVGPDAGANGAVNVAASGPQPQQARRSCSSAAWWPTSSARGARARCSGSSRRPTRATDASRSSAGPSGGSAARGSCSRSGAASTPPRRCHATRMRAAHAVWCDSAGRGNGGGRHRVRVAASGSEGQTRSGGEPKPKEVRRHPPASPGSSSRPSGCGAASWPARGLTCPRFLNTTDPCITVGSRAFGG